jgi:cell division protein FtsB
MTHPNLRELVKEIKKTPEELDLKLEKLYDERDKLCAKMYKLKTDARPMTEGIDKDAKRLEYKTLKRRVDTLSEQINKLSNTNK